MFNFFLSVLIIFFSLSGFAQRGRELEPLSSEGGHVIIKGAAGESAVNHAPHPYEKPPLTALEKIHNLGYEELNAKTLMDPKVVAILKEEIDQGLMAALPEAEVKAHLMLQVKGSRLESFLKKNPKILNAMVDFLRNKEALGGLLGIVARKNDLKKYGYFWLLMFTLTLLFKYRVIKPEWKFGKRFRWSMATNLVMSGICFYVFYGFFSRELTPTFQIIGKHFF